MSKKNEMLGMNHSTALARLTRDLLFDLVKGRPCARCGKALVRDNFSIDHMVPWRTAENPIETFFDISAVEYSHHTCNSGYTSRVKYRDKNLNHGAASVADGLSPR